MIQLFEEDKVEAAAEFCSTGFCSWLTTVCSYRGITPPGNHATAMAFKNTGKIPMEPEVAIHWIRITLTSCNVVFGEGVCWLDQRSKGKVKRPVWMSTKTLRITTRKTPCGKYSKTWDPFQMRIHKRLINLYSPSEIVRGC